jgi:hypothetical protein
MHDWIDKFAEIVQGQLFVNDGVVQGLFLWISVSSIYLTFQSIIAFTPYLSCLLTFPRCDSGSLEGSKRDS